MVDSHDLSRVAIMHRLAGGWDALIALFGIGAGSGLLGIVTRAQGLSQAEILTWVGLVSTIAGLVSSGLLVFYRRASKTLLEDAKEWDAYRGTTWQAKAEALHQTNVRLGLEIEEREADLRVIRAENAELRAALGDAYDRIERLVRGMAKTPHPDDAHAPKTKPKPPGAAK